MRGVAAAAAAAGKKQKVGAYLHAEDVLELGLQVQLGGGRRRRRFHHVRRDPQGRASPEGVQVDVPHHGNLAGRPLSPQSVGTRGRSRAIHT